MAYRDPRYDPLPPFDTNARPPVRIVRTLYWASDLVTIVFEFSDPTNQALFGRRAVFTLTLNELKRLIPEAVKKDPS